MPISINDRFTGSEYVLMAMTELLDQGKGEPTEWDITVHAWMLNKEKFGMTGYAHLFPDHKKVYVELIRKYINNNKTKINVMSNFIVKTKKSCYSLTPIASQIGRSLLIAHRSGRFDFLEKFSNTNRVMAMYDHFSNLSQENNG